MKILIALNYIYWIIAVIGLLFLFMLISYIIRRYQKKRIFSALDDHCIKNGYALSIASKKSYDYIINTDNRQLFIKTLIVPVPAAITINSKDTWNLTYGGRGRPGKGYPKQRYLYELCSFLRADLPGVKIVFIYPFLDKIQRYLNESEITLLNFQENAYGIRFITFEHWPGSLSDLI